MVIGSLRHRVTVCDKVTAEDNIGGTYDTWVDLFTISAKVEPVGAREQLFSMQMNHRVTHRVTIRYNANVLPEHRLTHKGRTLNIKGIRNEEERGVWMIIDCEEGGNG